LNRAIVRLAVAAVAGVTGLACLTAPSAVAVAGLSSQPAPNPYAGPIGTSFMHGDSEASDSTPYAGHREGEDAPHIARRGLPDDPGRLRRACPGTLHDHHDRDPTAYLIDPASGQPLAHLALAKGALLGGVYAYLNNDNQLIVANGSTSIARIEHQHSGAPGAGSPRSPPAPTSRRRSTPAADRPAATR
jgi:hypothetical protein